jgi:hypothetical protein
LAEVYQLTWYTTVPAPGVNVNVTTEVGYCPFCQRTRNLRREERHLGGLVRMIVSCESCNRTLSNTMGVPAAKPAEAPAMPEPKPKPEAEPEPGTPARPVRAPAATKARKPAAKRKAAPAKKAAATKKPATKKATTRKK